MHSTNCLNNTSSCFHLKKVRTITYAHTDIKHTCTNTSPHTWYHNLINNVSNRCTPVASAPHNLVSSSLFGVDGGGGGVLMCGLL